MQETEHQPEFLAPLDNFTVTQGRDISFTCVVNDLGPYRVSEYWINKYNLVGNSIFALFYCHTKLKQAIAGALGKIASWKVKNFFAHEI